MYGSKTSVKLYLLMPDLCCWAELHTAALRALVLARQWIANSSLLLKHAAVHTWRDQQCYAFNVTTSRACAGCAQTAERRHSQRSIGH